jgi:hypothetical protein
MRQGEWQQLCDYGNGRIAQLNAEIESLIRGNRDACDCIYNNDGACPEHSEEEIA